MQLLIGHTSPDNAHEIADYPYGFTLRCRKRYWIEFKKNHGFRVVTQTTNPKRGHAWNKPKAGIYATFGTVLYIDDAGHIQWTGLSEYCSATEARAWLGTFGPAVPEPGATLLRKFVAAKEAYEANRTSGDPLSTGLVEAHAAFRTA